MKFGCFCGNVINTTGGFCKEVCRLHIESEYIKWIKFLCDMISMKDYYPHSKRAFFAMNAKGILFLTVMTCTCLSPVLLK